MQKFWNRNRGDSTSQGENLALTQTPPFSSTKDAFNSSSDSLPTGAPQTVVYESVPIPQGYATPLGPVAATPAPAPQTPGARSFRAVEPPSHFGQNESTTPRFSRMSGMGSSPLANQESYGFTPMMTRQPMTPKTPYQDPKTPLSPTFREEQVLEKHEAVVEKLDQKDLRWKIRVRMGKVILRCLNFACSLVVLSLVASTLYIFHKTSQLPKRNGLPPWAPDTQLWVQYTVLGVSIVSVSIAMIILLAYWKGGHRRAERLAIYWTVMAVSSFILIIVMWSVVGGIHLTEKAQGEGKDLWGWACKDNTRRILFGEDVDYKLVCRQQDWVFVCAIIEIVVELMAIALYVFVFYRLMSKRKLRKSMDLRDKARTDIYLAKLREEDEPECPLTANNTALNAKADAGVYAAEEGRSNTSQQTFQLMPAPPRKSRASQDTRRTTDSAPVTPATGPGNGPAFPAYTPHGDYNATIQQSAVYNPHTTYENTLPSTPRSVSFQVNQQSSSLPPPPPQTPRQVAFRTSMVNDAGPGTPRLVKTVLMGRTPSPPEGGVPMTPRSAMAGSRTQTPPEGQAVIPPTPRSVSFRP